MRRPLRRVRASYSIAKVDPVNSRVWISDHDGALSVTNDAEAVVAEVLEKYPGHRIFYRDTDGNWDELVHAEGRFTGFAPAREMAL